MLPDIATLLMAGVRHVVLTLGADGAALCTLAANQRAVTGKLWMSGLAVRCVGSVSVTVQQGGAAQTPSPTPPITPQCATCQRSRPLW